MVKILELLAMLALWGVVGVVVWYVDPNIVRDVLVPRIHLPILVIMWVATAYTVSFFVSRLIYVLGIPTILVTLVGLLLVI